MIFSACSSGSAETPGATRYSMDEAGDQVRGISSLTYDSGEGLTPRCRICVTFYRRLHQISASRLNSLYYHFELGNKIYPGRMRIYSSFLLLFLNSLPPGRRFIVPHIRFYTRGFLGEKQPHKQCSDVTA